MPKLLKRGTQIIYVPSHANGDTEHPDCDRGFITSCKDDAESCFCRYWRKGEPGTLRTHLNSELTPVRNLVIQDSVAQSKVDETLALIDSE